MSRTDALSHLEDGPLNRTQSCSLATSRDSRSKRTSVSSGTRRELQIHPSRSRICCSGSKLRTYSMRTLSLWSLSSKSVLKKASDPATEPAVKNTSLMTSQSMVNTVNVCVAFLSPRLQVHQRQGRLLEALVGRNSSVLLFSSGASRISFSARPIARAWAMSPTAARKAIGASGVVTKVIASKAL